MPVTLTPADLEVIAETLRSLDRRITRLEEEYGITSARHDAHVAPAPALSSEAQSEQFEFELGFHWFARFGIVALAIGIAFLLTFNFEGVPPAAPALLGYLLVGALLAVSQMLSSSFNLVARYIMGGGMVLLYFTTLRLYFFSAVPVLDRTSVVQILPLIIAAAVNIAVALRRDSVYLFSFGLIMVYATALVIGGAEVLAAAGIITAAGSMVVARRRHWRSLVIVAPVLTYVAYALWAANDPILGNAVHMVSSGPVNLFLLHVYVVIFAAGEYFVRDPDGEEGAFDVLAAALNCTLYYGLLIVLTLVSFESLFMVQNAVSAAVLIALAIGVWTRQRSRYRTFVYAMLGYLALSALILKATAIPEAFIWLSMQSLLVLSTAIWFCSRFIVVANFFLYLVILIAYVATAGQVNSIGLAFGLVALLSARIMNWQQQRLELKTESMRNAYLAAAFLALPYMLLRIVPQGYVSLAWLCVAGMYYLLNILVQNQKYRWMGHLTLLLTVLYTLVVGIIALEATYRIVSFLLLGLVLLAASIIVTKKRAKSIAAAGAAATAPDAPATATNDHNDVHEL